MAFLFSVPRMSADADSQQRNRHLFNAVCGAVAASAVAAASVVAVAPVFAAPKLPPIDYSQRDRCTPASSSIGQANAARDSLLDLRECSLAKLSFHGDLSGALLADADLSNSDLKDAQLSKAFAQGIKLSGSDLSNAILDRVDFTKADLSNAILTNAVLSDSIFEDANVENADFTEAYIGDFGQRALCRNKTLKGQNPVTGVDTRVSLGCR